MLIDDHWDVWHLSTCHGGVICTRLRSVLWGETRCPVLIRPAVMFLMTSTPLRAERALVRTREEFQIFLPVTLIWMRVSSSKCAAFCRIAVCDLRDAKTLRRAEEELWGFGERGVNGEQMQLFRVISSLNCFCIACFIYIYEGAYCVIYLINGVCYGKLGQTSWWEMSSAQRMI